MHLDPPPQPSFTAVPAMAAAMDLALRSLHATLVHQWGPDSCTSTPESRAWICFESFYLVASPGFGWKGHLHCRVAMHIVRLLRNRHRGTSLERGSIGSGVQGPKSYDATTMSLVETRSGARPALDVTDESESTGTRITSFPPKPRVLLASSSLSLPLRGLICMHSRPPPADNGPQPPPLDPHVGLLLWTRGRGETKCPVTVDSISGSAISLLVHARNFRPPISSKDPFPPSSIPVAGNLSSGMRPEARISS